MGPAIVFWPTSIDIQHHLEAHDAEIERILAAVRLLRGA
jgi:hypothetical protein